jgi:MFS family permease
MSRFSDIFQNRNFFLLWSGQIVSEFGERITQMALIGLIYAKDPYSAVALAKLIIFIIVPVFLVGPVAGAYVDRWDRRYTMIISDFLRSLLVFLIPFAIGVFKEKLIPVYILVFLIFSTTRFFLPSKMAIIPDLVDKKHLLIANSLISTTRMIATVVGLGLAGILINITGPKGGFYINAATFLFSATMLSFVSTKEHIHLKKDLVETGHAIEEIIVKSPGIFTQIREGLRLLVTNRDVRLSMQSLFVVMAGLGAMSVVTIVFVQECFGSATKDIGLLGMLIGVGLFVGSLGYGRLGHYISKKKMIAISFIVSGIMTAGFVLVAKQTRMLSLASVFAVLLGVAGSPIIISSNTIIHETIPEKIRGRVFSSVEAVVHLAFLVCMLLAAKAADLVGRDGVLLACGGVFALFGLLGLARGTGCKT